jgi:hypothetical protein
MPAEPVLLDRAASAPESFNHTGVGSRAKESSRLCRAGKWREEGIDPSPNRERFVNALPLRTSAQ